MTALKTQVDQMDTRLAGVEQKVEKIHDRVEYLKEKVMEHDQDIFQINRKLSGRA
ncbi:MAG TPA: hypothetical protein GX517_11555 [Alicyclobacillus sp.]|nr:hypothetical protein [Alicyclobacillus sp.]